MIEEKILNDEFVLIAEIGVNYYDIAQKLKISNMEAAKLMIREAKEAGIDAVKFQSYKANTISVKDSPAYWDQNEEATSTQFELFSKFDSFGENEYRELQLYCDEMGIEFLSTAFDFSSADYLDDLMSVYKISSSDLNNIPFIEHQAKKGKMIILSTGASELEEIKNAIRSIRKYNDKLIVLMHCVLEYPTPYEDANLRKILTLKKEFPDLIIGYSDHTKPDGNYNVIKAAYLLGATVVEKHFTLDKTLKGNDHYHAMDPNDAKKIIQEILFLNKICGDGTIHCLENEKISRENARRSIVVVCDKKAGEKIFRKDLDFKRPGVGISPEKLPEVLGKN